MYRMLGLASALILAAGASSVVAAEDTEVCFFDRDSFTMKSNQTGIETGSIVEHVRDCGRLRVEIKNTQTSMMGFTTSTSQRVIYDGPKIITVDNTTGQVTVADNPMYDNMVAAMQNSQQSGVELGEAFATGMGGVATGETGTFAGEDCAYWSVPQLGSTFCLASWGATLHSRTAMGPAQMERTVFEILDDAGSDSAFQYDLNAAQPIPNLQDLMQGLGQPQQQ